jgi:hypothetical protein
MWDVFRPALELLIRAGGGKYKPSPAAPSPQARHYVDQARALAQLTFLSLFR